MKSRQSFSALVVALILVSLAAVAQASQPADNQLVVTTLSTDAPKSSSGDGSYGIDIRSNASPSDIAVTLNRSAAQRVCDYESIGARRHALDGTWLDYSHQAALLGITCAGGVAEPR